MKVRLLAFLLDQIPCRMIEFLMAMKNKFWLFKEINKKKDLYCSSSFHIILLMTCSSRLFESKPISLAYVIQADTYFLWASHLVVCILAAIYNHL